MITASPSTSCCRPTTTALGGWVRASTSCTATRAMTGTAAPQGNQPTRTPTSASPTAPTWARSWGHRRCGSALGPTQLEADERQRRDGPSHDHEPGARGQGRGFAGRQHDGRRHRADPDGAGQLGDQAAAAAAHVEPQLDGDQRNGRDERDPERPGRGRGRGGEEADEQRQLGGGDARGDARAGQRSTSPAIHEHQLGRRASHERDHRRPADGQPGDARGDDQPEQHRFEGQPPAAMLCGQGDAPPDRTRSGRLGGSRDERRRPGPSNTSSHS